jgi:hypothetical protein
MAFPECGFRVGCDKDLGHSKSAFTVPEFTVLGRSRIVTPLTDSLSKSRTICFERFCYPDNSPCERLLLWQTKVEIFRVSHHHHARDCPVVVDLQKIRKLRGTVTHRLGQTQRGCSPTQGWWCKVRYFRTSNSWWG